MTLTSWLMLSGCVALPPLWPGSTAITSPASGGVRGRADAFGESLGDGVGGRAGEPDAAATARWLGRSVGCAAAPTLPSSAQPAPPSSAQARTAARSPRRKGQARTTAASHVDRPVGFRQMVPAPRFLLHRLDILPAAATGPGPVKPASGRQRAKPRSLADRPPRYGPDARSQRACATRFIIPGRFTEYVPENAPRSLPVATVRVPVPTTG